MIINGKEASTQYVYGFKLSHTGVFVPLGAIHLENNVDINNPVFLDALLDEVKKAIIRHVGETIIPTVKHIGE